MALQQQQPPPVYTPEEILQLNHSIFDTSTGLRPNKLLPPLSPALTPRHQYHVCAYNAVILKNNVLFFTLMIGFTMIFSMPAALSAIATANTFGVRHWTAPVYCTNVVLNTTINITSTMHDLLLNASRRIDEETDMIFYQIALKTSTVAEWIVQVYTFTRICLLIIVAILLKCLNQLLILFRDYIFQQHGRFLMRWFVVTLIYLAYSTTFWYFGVFDRLLCELMKWVEMDKLYLQVRRDFNLLYAKHTAFDKRVDGRQYRMYLADHRELDG